MDKFTFKTADGVDVNLEKLSQAFPEVITETVGEDGKIKRVADFEKLKMLLGDSAAEHPQEFYEFTWPGKNEAIMKAAEATTKTLRPCPEESKNWDTTQNLYIEGDNLEALKILQKTYLGKVKMIYIDPPYNTGKDFVYRDNFHKSAEEGKEDETVRDEETDNNLFQNTESNGRFHSDWCSMIYPRLKLARDLLRDDGVIFISIDDNEVHNLRKICDEIFGESNFVGNIICKTATDNNKTQIACEHEYIICYSKHINNQLPWEVASEKGLLILNKFNELRAQNKDIQDVQTKLRKWINENQSQLTGASHYTYADEKGPFYPGNSSNTKPGNYMYDIIHPITKKACAKPTNGYRWPLSTFMKAYSNNDVLWGEDETIIPKIKKRIETVVEKLKSYYYEDNRKTTAELKSLFDNVGVFENPKSIRLIRYISKFILAKEDSILDFFSGSATTAHACMQLNAEDGGNRKFIMVQLPEVCAPESEAAKAGYKNICEIGKERIRRAGEKIKAEHATTAPNLDIGFRVLKIDESIMKDVFYSPNETSQDLLSTLESNIKEDRTDLDLLFACLVNWGVELSMPLKTESIDGVEIHTMNDGDTPALIACFAQNIPETVVRKIAARHPLRAVFRDSSFADSPAKINLTEIFKTYSPETDVKVL